MHSVRVSPSAIRSTPEEDAEIERLSGEDPDSAPPDRLVVVRIYLHSR